MTLQEKIQSDLAGAMRTKDALRLSVLRMMKSAATNIQADMLTSLDEYHLVA